MTVHPVTGEVVNNSQAAALFTFWSTIVGFTCSYLITAVHLIVLGTAIIARVTLGKGRQKFKPKLFFWIKIMFLFFFLENIKARRSLKCFASNYPTHAITTGLSILRRQ
ncbi:unnamed protein product [Oikopleura dioica]|uniref:Uncharacterized protein n=1 Tax=Oikopleura dioica TaxID=34765 RepID=E4XFP7_OIKDI|nr:unnamed protein product [Oikopleura dioica]CBY38219.1 unnamed protein product [Oikopleura dioica]